MNQLKNMPSSLSNLKSNVVKLDTGKSKTAPVDLSKLSNVVKNDVPKKTECDELFKKVNTFWSSVTFLYPLNTSENQRFSGVFRGTEM